MGPLPASKPRPTPRNSYPFSATSQQFLQSTPTYLLVRILTSFGVDILPTTLTDDRELLERRIMLLVAESQRLRDLPTTTSTAPPDIETLPSIFGSSLPTASLVSDAIEGEGNIHVQLTAVLQSIASHLVAGISRFVLADERDGSSHVLISITSVRTSRCGTPILHLRFWHEADENPSADGFYAGDSLIPVWNEEHRPGVVVVGCGVDVQGLLVRVLLYNATKVDGEGEDVEGVEDRFLRSFLCPVDAVGGDVRRVLALPPPTTVRLEGKGEEVEVLVCGSSVYPSILHSLHALYDSTTPLPPWNHFRNTSINGPSDLEYAYGTDESFGLAGFLRSREVRGDGVFIVKVVFRDRLTRGDGMCLRIRDRERTFDVFVYREGHEGVFKRVGEFVEGRRMCYLMARHGREVCELVLGLGRVVKEDGGW